MRVFITYSSYRRRPVSIVFLLGYSFHINPVIYLLLHRIQITKHPDWGVVIRVLYSAQCSVTVIRVHTILCIWVCPTLRILLIHAVDEYRTNRVLL